MIKFNSENIFVGHIKQLLASFNLPKYHVYTEEQLDYHNKYLTAKNDISEVAEKVEELEARIAAETDEEAKKELLRQQYDLKLLHKDYEDTLETGPEKDILISAVRNVAPKYPTNETEYPTYMRYIPYIKDNRIQIYAPTIGSDGKPTYSDDDWKDCHAAYAPNHAKIHAKNANIVTPIGYAYNLKIRNYTKTLKIQNNVYDSYTHEYLGDYLRFQRDYNHVDLMPLYNCFSNRLCQKLSLEFDVYGTGGYTASFDASNAKYKIYMMPVKLFKQYTIAIDSMSDVEVCCGLYGQYQYAKEYDEISKKTYQCFNSMTFGEPVLYDKIKNLNAYLSIDNALELAQHEQDLKLFIKLPASNKSAIVVLEGDYTYYTNATLIKYYPTEKSKYTVEQNVLNLQTPASYGYWYETAFDSGTGTFTFDANDRTYSVTTVNELDHELHTKNYSTQRNTRESADGGFVVLTNHTELNLDGDVKENIKHLSSPLQLLRQNTGVSYPFADRLIEFLTGNMITPIDRISDNIARAKKVIHARTNALRSDEGIWEDSMQILLYNYMSKHYDRLSNYHDILGYVDKDTERLYSNGSKTNKETIASADIYDGNWED